MVAADDMEHEVELRSTQELRLLGPRALVVIGVLCAAPSWLSGGLL